VRQRDVAGFHVIRQVSRFVLAMQKVGRDVAAHGVANADRSTCGDQDRDVKRLFQKAGADFGSWTRLWAVIVQEGS
jgi:hypothetical protein